MIGLVLAAAGSGTRFGSEIPKQFCRLRGNPLYLTALEPFLPLVSEAVVVAPAGWQDSIRRKLEERKLEGRVKVVEGGARRQNSVYRGLLALGDQIDLVLVHDAARPFVTKELIERVIKTACTAGACIPVMVVADTVKEVQGGLVIRTVDRNRLRLAQTPQGFHKSLLRKAFEKAFRDHFYGTDEASLVEHLGERVQMVEGEGGNVKVTWKEDLPVMKPPIRIGTGFDFHPFERGRPLVLGGVRIQHPEGLKGHSDADALLHAVSDALLGAAGLADIGSYFPDTDPRYHGISSLLLLEKVYRLIRGKGYSIVNIDLVVLADAPRIKPHVEAIKANLSRVLRLKPAEIGIKATTMEGKGAIGRGEGVAVQAVALLYQVEEEKSEESR